MGTAVLGRIGVVLESLTNPGEVLLMPNTAISALPGSLATQPGAVAGASQYADMRLLIVVTGNTSSGTITVTGKDGTQAQAVAAETTPTFAAAGSASNPTGTSEYTTTAVYSTVNASGVTVSGLTGGTVRIYGIMAARFAVPAMADIEEKFGMFSPQEQRGLMSRDTNIQPLTKQVAISKIEQTFYPEDLSYLPFVTTGAAPALVPLPGTAQVVKASTLISAFPITVFTAQPNTMGSGGIIQLVIGSNTTAGTLTLTGTSITSGAVISEVIAVTSAASSTVYSVNGYATLTNVSFTGMIATATVTVNAMITVLKAVTTVAGGALSLTTQPNTLGPDSILQFIVTASAAIGTIVVVGTNRLGLAISETVLAGFPGGANGNGTWYTQQAFATVGTLGVSFTGLTSGSVLINGLMGFQQTWIAGPPASGAAGLGGSDQLYTAAIEWFTGTDAVSVPFFYVTETTIEFGTEKEMKVTTKGGAQDMLTIGDRTTTPMVASTRSVGFGPIGAFQSLWQPFDVGLSGWQVQVFIDALSGTPGTNFYNQVLSGKITFKTPQVPSYPAINWQRFQKLYRQQRETDIDLVIDFVDVVQYEQFRQQFVKQLLTIQFIGPFLGSNIGVIYYKQWTYTFAAKTLTFKRDPSKLEKVEAALTLRAEFTPLLGYEYKLVTITQQVPTYNA